MVPAGRFLCSRMDRSVSVQFRFGPFQMRPDRRELFADGRTVTLHARTFDLLEFLIRHRDRVLSRDEILSAVWSGVVVSDNNLNVQMSALRRALSAHAETSNLVASLPGRGYRFVGEVQEEVAGGADAVAGAVEGEAAPRRSLARRFWARACVVAVAATAVVAVTVASERGLRPVTQPYPGVLLDRVQASGSAQARSLADPYQDAIRSRLGIFGDIRVLTPDKLKGAVRSVSYELAETISASASGTTLSYTLTDRESGDVVSADVTDVSNRTDRATLDNEAMDVVRQIRPALYRSERARHPGPPRTAFEDLVAAQVASSGQLTPDHVDLAISLAGRALRLDPGSVPIRIKLASLLGHRLGISPAEEGDEDGRRALAVLDPVIQSSPDNFVALALRAATLVALDQPKAAETCARLGLAIEPGDAFLTDVLAEASIERGDLDEASSIAATAAALDHPLEDAVLAQLSFAQRRYQAAEVADERELAAEPVVLHRGLMTLLLAATLVRLGRTDDARHEVLEARTSLPAAFDHLGALRASYYDFSPSAWRDMSDALSTAGMVGSGSTRSEIAFDDGRP